MNKRIEIAESVVDAIDRGSKKFLTKTNHVMKNTVIPVSDRLIGKAVDFADEYTGGVTRGIKHFVQAW